MCEPPSIEKEGKVLQSSRSRRTVGPTSIMRTEKGNVGRSGGKGEKLVARKKRVNRFERTANGGGGGEVGRRQRGRGGGTGWVAAGKEKKTLFSP